MAAPPGPLIQLQAFNALKETLSGYDHNKMMTRTEVFLLAEFGGPGSGPLRHLSTDVKSDWTCRSLMSGKGIDLESGQTCASTEHSKDACHVGALSEQWRI